MKKIEQLNEHLQKVAKVLHQVKEELADKHIRAEEKNIHKIGDSLALIIGIQDDIAKLAENVIPHLFKKRNINHEDTVRLTRVIGTAVELESFGMIDEAITLYRLFISEDHPSSIIDIAKTQLDKLQERKDI
jgi:hypothetical protein